MHRSVIHTIRARLLHCNAASVFSRAAAYSTLTKTPIRISNNVNGFRKVSCNRCGRICVGRIHFSMVFLCAFTTDFSSCCPLSLSLFFSHFIRIHETISYEYSYVLAVFFTFLFSSPSAAPSLSRSCSQHHGKNSTANSIRYTPPTDMSDSLRRKLEISVRTHVPVCAFSILENEYINKPRKNTFTCTLFNVYFGVFGCVCVCFIL